MLHGRDAYVLENGAVRVSALRGGGHLGEIRFLDGDASHTINPMRVPGYQTIEPYNFDATKDRALYQSAFLAGYMGQLLCFPEFGGLPEAAIVEWKIADTEVRADAVALRYEADLPRTQFRVGRTITLPAQSSVIQVEEWAENLAPFGRPIHWVQHVTFGPPFAEPGKNNLDMPSARWAGGRLGAGLTDTPAHWPYSLKADGTPEDVRQLISAPHSTRYNAYLFDHAGAYSYFTMYNSGYTVLVGYIFPAADNPWILDWQENCSYLDKPWDGKEVARGIEIGTTPFDEGLRRSLERGPHLGKLPFRWIGGKQRLTTRYLIFLAAIPKGFAGVQNVQMSGGKILVQVRGSGQAISIDQAGAACCEGQ
jgi:hypothetical protein